MTRSLAEDLARALAGPLPGAPAQALMAPRPRPGWAPGFSPEQARNAAALLLLFPRGERAHLVLTVRQVHLPSHPGQVSFPGGAVDHGETFAEAALREAREEIDCDPRAVAIVGPLTPLHIPVSRFVLHPFVALASCEPSFRALDAEVARVLEPSLDEIADPANHLVETRHFEGTSFVVPYFAVDGEKVWGATAMILAEFLAALGRPPRPPAAAAE